MNQKQLERGQTIKDLLEKLFEQRKGLSLSATAETRRISYGIEGREGNGEAWKTASGATISNLIGGEETKGILEVTRVLLLAKVDQKIKELQTEFENL